MPNPVIVVHGGAGQIRRGDPPDDPEVHAALADAIAAAGAALDAGEPALDAAQRAVERLEACPRFNAGTGSVVTADGEIEMDAALMDGATGRAGAVAAVRAPRHPIALARAVLDHSAHVLLAGEGAERFGAAHGVGTVAPGAHLVEPERGHPPDPTPGTVGAVVLDAQGRLAAATSTGGMRGQLPGRIGDSPLIGAGTYAAAGVCAVSTSGHGEALIRAVAAHEVAALMTHAGVPLAEAARRVIAGIETEAALIAVDAAGAFAMPFNTPIFNRGWQVPGAAPRTAIGLA